MNSNKYFVTLSGSKNNAGDFLIKHRALNLFKEIRPDRTIIDYNEWEYLDDQKLEVVNQSQGLILVGGPGLVYGMYPNGGYRLRENLDDIKVPILMMGVGWKDPQGDWDNTYSYHFSEPSKRLLDRISESNYFSSVRDFHTLNMLQHMGYENFLMTGCPAYYDLAYLHKPFTEYTIDKVAFSLGVSFIGNHKVEQHMKALILSLRERFRTNSFEVVFHHSLDVEKIMKVYGKKSLKHVKSHIDFSTWLSDENIPYVDISGSAENLMNYYSDVDLHIGYRVHAHIFMNSISKYSILINEDGRGKAIEKVIGGVTVNSFMKYKKSFLSKLMKRTMKSYNMFEINEHMTNELFNSLTYENITNYNRVMAARKKVDSNFLIMKKFLEQLP